MFLHETNWKYSPDSTGQRAQSWTVVNKLQRASECSFISTIPSNGTHCMFKIWGVEEDGRNEKKMKLKRKSIAERVKSFHLKTTTKTTILPLNNWNSNLDIKRRKKKKRFILFSSVYFSTKSISRDCYHASRDCKCLLSSFPSIEMYIRHYREKTGARKKWNKTKPKHSPSKKILFFFPFFFSFSWISKEWCVLKTNPFSLPTCTTGTHTCTHTHTHTHTGFWSRCRHPPSK